MISASIHGIYPSDTENVNSKETGIEWSIDLFKSELKESMGMQSKRALTNDRIADYSANYLDNKLVLNRQLGYKESMKGLG